MPQVTIGARNQIVIPLAVRKKISGFQPGRKITAYSADSETVILKLSEKSWLEQSYGVMRQSWGTTKPTRQLEHMRNEWDEK